MSITDLLSDRDHPGEQGPRRSVASVRDRLEAGTDSIGELSTRVRRAATERTGDVLGREVDDLRKRTVEQVVDEFGDGFGEASLERAIAGVRDGSLEETVTDLRDRSSDHLDDVRERLVDRAVTECCERLVGQSPDELRERAGDTGAGAVDPLERAVEDFLRRYGLEKARLDDDTLDAIRDRVAAEADVDADEVLERLLEEGATGTAASRADGPAADTPDSIATALYDGYSQLLEELDVDSDQSFDEIVDDVRQRDAVVVGHAVEAALEDVPQFERLLEDGPRIGQLLEAGPRFEDLREAAATADLEPDAPVPPTNDATDASATEQPRITPASSGGGSRGSQRPLEGGAEGGPRSPLQGTAEDGLPRALEGVAGNRGSVRSAVAMAVTAMAVLTDDGTPTPSADRLLPILTSALSGVGAGDGGDDGDGGPALERALVSLLSTLVLDADGGLDLTALRPDSATSKGSVALVGLFVANLVAMTVGAWVSRKKAPPIPDEIRDPDGEPIVTGEQVRLGKKAFQANGLMSQGSILGNGSYFGVDLTADALELKAEYMRDYYARQHGADSFEALAADDRAAVADRVERELDGDAPEGSIAQYSAAEAYAHRRIRDAYVDRYYGGSPERGIPQGFVDTADEAARIADFACWTAWMAHTDRPGSDHSYTNDWPYVPGTGNRPTGQVLVWSTISVVLLVAGGGAGVRAYHEFDFAEPTTELVDVPAPDSVSITPTQYAAGWYVPVAGALFAAQVLVGALLAHYYVERTGFYGIGDALGVDIVSLIPFSVGRTWHINLGVLWITTLWLAGGLFLPGLFTDSDPPRQAQGATALLGALVFATVGAFVGVWLSSQGAFSSPDSGDLWWWLGSESLEYLEVGRFWKLLLLGGFVGWTGLVLRSVRRLEEPPTGLGHFMTYAGGSIALMFGASMLYTPETNIAVTEFWRWWVVHMWVEGVFEFFVTAVVSVALVSMDLLEKSAAEQAIFFEVFTIMAAGIVGVSHHYWWVGLPDIWVPIGTTFSTLEFVPLIFVLYRSFGEYRSLQAQGEEFPYTLPLLFIVGSSVWNFVGGGVLGFFINLPVINYYEHGTYLTVAHGHAATFGAFGLLALGLGTYILRVITPEASWSPTWFRGAFWLTNIGLTVMTAASLLPGGFLQLQTSYQDGYAAARSLEFYERDRVQTLLWARTLGDTPMILGALAFTVGAIRHLWAARGRALETTTEENTRWSPLR